MKTRSPGKASLGNLDQERLILDSIRPEMNGLVSMTNTKNYWLRTKGEKESVRST